MRTWNRRPVGIDGPNEHNYLQIYRRRLVCNLNYGGCRVPQRSEVLLHPFSPLLCIWVSSRYAVMLSGTLKNGGAVLILILLGLGLELSGSKLSALAAQCLVLDERLPREFHKDRADRDRVENAGSSSGTAT